MGHPNGHGSKKPIALDLVLYYFHYLSKKQSKAKAIMTKKVNKACVWLSGDSGEPLVVLAGWSTIQRGNHFQNDFQSKYTNISYVNIFFSLYIGSFAQNLKKWLRSLLDHYKH